MKESKYPLPESVDIALQAREDDNYQEHLMRICSFPLGARTENEYQVRFHNTVKDLARFLGHDIPASPEARFELISHCSNILKDLLYGNIIEYNLGDSIIFTRENKVDTRNYRHRVMMPNDIAYILSLKDAKKREKRILYLAKMLVRSEAHYLDDFTDTYGATMLIFAKSQIYAALRSSGEEVNSDL